MMNMIYNTMYEDEYDDTYDTSGLNMRGIDLHTVDEIDELGTSSRDKAEVISYNLEIYTKKKCILIYFFH